MTKKPSPRSIEFWRDHMDEDRSRNPDRFLGEPDGLGPDFLFVENVARMLGCNVDFVRRIPRADLPASKVGQRLIYSREAIDNYMKSRRGNPTRRFVPSRAPGRYRATVAPAPVARGFDPVAFARSLAKEAK